MIPTFPPDPSLSHWFHRCMYSGQDSNTCWSCVMQILALGMRAHPKAPSFKTLHVPFSQSCHAKRLTVSLHNSPSRKQLPLTSWKCPRGPAWRAASCHWSVLPLKRTLIPLSCHTHDTHLHSSCATEWLRGPRSGCLRGSGRRLARFCMTAAFGC